MPRSPARQIAFALLAPIWLALLVAPPAWANAPGQACRAAISAAEREQGIPEGLLQAIGIVESGQRSAETGTLLPWPWAVNVGGQGSLAPDRDAAVALVNQGLLRGQRSIDVGCLQINLQHHPRAFAQLEDGFDPTLNARYGARFLASLRDRTGSWSTAAAQYHSATPDRGAAYQARVMAQWTGLGGVVPPGGRGVPALSPQRDARAPLWATAGMGVPVFRPTTPTVIPPPTTPAMRIMPIGAVAPRRGS